MSQISTVEEHLGRRFADQRVVIWHDPEGEHIAELDQIQLPEGVVVLSVANNEFQLKHRVLTERETKFLVYRSGPVPPAVGNWLLDLELSYGVFTADRVSLIQQTLGLASEQTAQTVTEHETFFRSAKRSEALKALLAPDDDAARIKAKMVQVLIGAPHHRMEEITRTLLIGHAEGKKDKYQLLVDHGLADFHWQGAQEFYGYVSESPGVWDFVLWLFKGAQHDFSELDGAQQHRVRVDFSRLRDSVQSAGPMKRLARRVSQEIYYRQVVADTPYRDLLDSTVFPEADQRIIADLAFGSADFTVSYAEVEHTADLRRRRSPWVEEYDHLYRAVTTGAELLAAIQQFDPTVPDMDTALERYRNAWFRIDQLYRQFCTADREAQFQEPLEVLRSAVNNHYENSYLYQLGLAWQKHVDAADAWKSRALPAQSSFYRKHVAPIVRGGKKKAVVIISDGLRYEIAEELSARIRREDKFDAGIDAMLGVIPSYTQLGMAALLPHQRREHSANGDAVLADGQRTNSTEARKAILESVAGTAIQAERFMALSREEQRKLYRVHQVLYIYHDRIDETGDSSKSEDRVFEAVEETLRELSELVRRLTHANATNILITADHGFLYQAQPLSDGFWLSEKPQGEQILENKHRYVLGRGLQQSKAFRLFEPDQAGLSSDIQVQLPKSIHRQRLPGSGSRYVHGGAMPQEIVVPVVTVRKKRESDTQLVEVAVLQETNKITTSQLVVQLYQTEPVTEKVHPRTLRLGVYAGDELLSDQVSEIFDDTTRLQRDRERRVTLRLSPDTDRYKNQQVELRIEESITGTGHWRPYRSMPYMMVRSIGADFDF